MAQVNVNNRVQEAIAQLPEEDAEEGLCGLRIDSMDGARGAAQTWEVAYARVHFSDGL